MANTNYFHKGNEIVDGNGDAVVIMNGNTITTTDRFPSGGVTPEIEQEIERALMGNHVYTTYERECGEWIDGKTIYESVIALDTAISIGDVWTTPTELTIPDCDTMIDCIGLRNDEQGAGNVLTHLSYWKEDGVKKLRALTRFNIYTFIFKYTKND